jgi:hypothetical protein
MRSIAFSPRSGSGHQSNCIVLNPSLALEDRLAAKIPNAGVCAFSVFSVVWFVIVVVVVPK